MLLSDEKLDNDPSDLWRDNVVSDNDVANFTEEQCLQLTQDFIGESFRRCHGNMELFLSGQ